MIEEIIVTQTPASGLKAEDESSAVSWAAVIAGAFAASAFSLILVTLGAGIGLVSVSPWSSNNPSVTTFGALAAAWFIAVQLFACGVGGYLAGRLRTKWARAHTDEVYFRDTAHGLLVWAVGAVISAALLALAASSAVSGAAHLAGAATEAVGQAAGAASGQAAGQAASLDDPTAYFADMLWRSDHPPQGDQGSAQAEAARILARALYSGDLPAPDKTYLAQLVAGGTGMSQPDAQKRVDDVFNQAKSAKAQAADKAKQAAEAARKTGVYVALWAFISLLVGAFSASYMATVGGRQNEAPLVA
ncbi:MAG TPA: hypothetical protein VMB83_01010 [Roseiarcus sp.]|nr:hypothetical protein [Roseiarcus sp.]